MRYTGVVPDLFKETKGVIAEGVYQPGAVFQADSVLAKHDENYMPKEVVEALKKRGEWRPEEGKPGQKSARNVITELGLFLATLALIASLSQAGFGLYGGHKADARASAVSAACAQVAAFGTIAALALLIASFIRSDFSLSVVANNSHTDKPLLYKIAGAWGNHEGSMLLWCTVSALFGAVFASAPGQAFARSLWSRAVGVQGAVTAGALIYTLACASWPPGRRGCRRSRRRPAPPGHPRRRGSCRRP